MASKNFGRFFGKGKKKEEKVSKIMKSKSADGVPAVHSDSEEDSYEDPSFAFPTDAPPGTGMPSMPNYPPPRLNSCGPTIISKRGDDYIEPYDSKLSVNGPTSPSVDSEQSANNYADPFDSKFSEQNFNHLNNNDNSNDDDDEYDLPYESAGKYNKKTDNADNYSTPWDSDKRLPPVPSDNDNYSAPWDMPKGIPGTKSCSRNIKNNRQDEYSDPWDTKNSSSPKSQDASFDDTYSEPYDKGKSTILDGKKRVHESLVEDDIEFSDKEKRVFGLNVSNNDNVNNSALKLATSNLSQDPPQAPSGDYDAPWDWKVKKIESDFEKACKIEAASPAPEIKTNADPVVTQDDSSTASGNEYVTDITDLTDKDYQVDPTIPLPNQGWFHGRIRRFEAEKLLEAGPDCSYLIRNSESSKIDYSLSIRNNGVPIHLRISCRDKKYILGVNSRPFDTIPEMIHHYSMNKLNIRGAEQVKLQYPCLQEAVYFTVVPGS